MSSRSQSFVRPARSWRAGLLWRRALTVVVVAFVLCYPVYDLLHQAITHGIYRRGNVLVVDLKSMSDFPLDQKYGQSKDIPAAYRALDGKRVMLAGEMYSPENASALIDHFTLVYSIANCCFMGPPQVQHFIKATTAPGHYVSYVRGIVNVIGVLHVGVEHDAAGVSSVYRLDVEQVNP